MSHKNADPNCPICHGYGMIVETDTQKSAPACKCTYEPSGVYDAEQLRQNIAKLQSPFLPTTSEGENIAQEWVDEYVIMRDHCKALAAALQHMLWMSDKWGKEWFDKETWDKKSEAAQVLDNYQQSTKVAPNEDRQHSPTSGREEGKEMYKRYDLLKNQEQQIGYIIGWADAIEYKESHPSPEGPTEEEINEAFQDNSPYGAHPHPNNQGEADAWEDGFESGVKWLQSYNSKPIKP